MRYCTESTRPRPRRAISFPIQVAVVKAMEGEPLKKLHAHLCASLARTPSSLRWDIKRDARRLSPPPLHAEKPPPLPRQSFHQREKEGERESAAHPPSLLACFRPRLSTSFASESVSVVWWLAREERQRRLVCVYVFLLAPSAFGAPTIMGGTEGGRREKGRERTKVRGFYDIPRRRQERQHKGPQD